MVAKRGGERRAVAGGAQPAPHPVARPPKPLKAAKPQDAPAQVLLPRFARGLVRPTIERPQYKPNRFFMKCLRLLTAIAVFVAVTHPALAADPTFPPGVRVGLTPLVGLTAAKTFSGFESAV